MKSAKVRFFRASSAACRDCVAAGFDDEALLWEGSVYAEEMGYAKFAVGFDMTVVSYQTFRTFRSLNVILYDDDGFFNTCS
jgi:hypothetical protein